MDKVLYQVGVAVAGTVAGLMIGNAGELAKAQAPITPLKFAMRYVEGGKHKVATLPVSLHWGGVAKEMFDMVQASAAEIDKTLYLQRIRKFFEIRESLQELTAYAKEITWHTKDAGFNAFMAALDKRKPGQRITPVRVLSSRG